MTFFENLVLTKCISSNSRIPIHQVDSSVIFGGIRNTKNWSKSIAQCKSHQITQKTFYQGRKQNIPHLSTSESI